MRTIGIAGRTFAAGTKEMIHLPVTIDLDGGEVAIWVHVVIGVKPGPTLLLAGIQHGDEWGEIDLFRKIIAETDPAELAGTLLVIPVCNPPALGTLTRLSQFSADGPDMNRIWPGSFNWLAEAIAKVISREILPKVDALIDFHFGMWGSLLGLTTYGVDYPDTMLNKRVRELAFAYGWPLLHRVNVCSGYPGPRSLMGYAGIKHSIPGIAAEVGGMGFGLEIENKWLAFNVTGVQNVMKHLGMLPGKPILPERFLDYTVNHRIDPSKGGLLVPIHEPDELMRPVKKGEVLAHVISPYTFEVLEELVSPCDGVLSLVPRRYPVRPGDWAFFVADTSAPDSRWVTGP